MTGEFLLEHLQLKLKYIDLIFLYHSKKECNNSQIFSSPLQLL